MSGEFVVRIQITKDGYRTLPMDPELARDLAEAMAEVRHAVECENVARNTFRTKHELDALQAKVDRRREMEARAVALFEAVLTGIPAWIANHPTEHKNYERREKRRQQAA